MGNGKPNTMDCAAGSNDMVSSSGIEEVFNTDANIERIADMETKLSADGAGMSMMSPNSAMDYFLSLIKMNKVELVHYIHGAVGCFRETVRPHPSFAALLQKHPTTEETSNIDRNAVIDHLFNNKIRWPLSKVDAVAGTLTASSIVNVVAIVMNEIKMLTAPLNSHPILCTLYDKYGTDALAISSCLPTGSTVLCGCTDRESYMLTLCSLLEFINSPRYFGRDAVGILPVIPDEFDKKPATWATVVYSNDESLNTTTLERYKTWFLPAESTVRVLISRINPVNWVPSDRLNEDDIRAEQVSVQCCGFNLSELGDTFPIYLIVFQKAIDLGSVSNLTKKFSQLEGALDLPTNFFQKHSGELVTLKQTYIKHFNKTLDSYNLGVRTSRRLGRMQELEELFMHTRNCCVVCVKKRSFWNEPLIPCVLCTNMVHMRKGPGYCSTSLDLGEITEMPHPGSGVCLHCVTSLIDLNRYNELTKPSPRERKFVDEFEDFYGRASKWNLFLPLALDVSRPDDLHFESYYTPDSKLLSIVRQKGKDLFFGLGSQVILEKGVVDQFIECSHEGVTDSAWAYFAALELTLSDDGTSLFVTRMTRILSVSSDNKSFNVVFSCDHVVKQRPGIRVEGKMWNPKEFLSTKFITDQLTPFLIKNQPPTSQSSEEEVIPVKVAVKKPPRKFRGGKAKRSGQGSISRSYGTRSSGAAVTGEIETASDFNAVSKNIIELKRVLDAKDRELQKVAAKEVQLLAEIATLKYDKRNLLGEVAKVKQENASSAVRYVTLFFYIMLHAGCSS